MESSVSTAGGTSDADTASAPPLVPGGFLVGNARSVYRDPFRFLLGQYRELGPVFRFKAGFHDYVVLAGPEANAWVHEDRAEHLRSAGFWKPIVDELGTPNNILTIDGPDHRKIRQQLAPHMAPAVVERRLDDVVGFTRQALEAHPVGDPIPFVWFSQQLVATQVGYLLTGRTLRDGELETLLDYLNTVFVALGAMRLPRWSLALRGPRFRRQRRTTRAIGGGSWPRSGPPRPPARTAAIATATRSSSSRSDSRTGSPSATSRPTCSSRSSSGWTRWARPSCSPCGSFSVDPTSSSGSGPRSTGPSRTASPTSRPSGR